MRRGLGRGRSLIAVGAVITIVGMPLPWLTVGGIVLPAQTANGFEGAGVVMFLAVVAMLAVIVLPYATRTRRVAIDRAIVYVGLLMVGLAGLSAQIVDLLSAEGSRLTPLEAPGLWLAVIGMAITTWGVLELLAEREPAP